MARSCQVREHDSRLREQIERLAAAWRRSWTNLDLRKRKPEAFARFPQGARPWTLPVPAFDITGEAEMMLVVLLGAR
jgi:hypothetical protein